MSKRRYSDRARLDVEPWEAAVVVGLAFTIPLVLLFIVWRIWW